MLSDLKSIAVKATPIASMSWATATRRVDVNGQVLTFGLEPVYVRAAELPPQLADDPKLRIEKVDSAPPDMEVIELLKPERVQDPAPAPSRPRPASAGDPVPARHALGAGRVLFPGGS